MGVLFIATCCYSFGSVLFFPSFLLFFFSYKNRQYSYQIKHQRLYLVEQSEEYP